MNRQGFPYDQGQQPMPTGRLLCGYPLEDVADGTLCRNTAPCVVHRDRDLSPADGIAASNPVPGLYEKVTGKTLPAFAAMVTRAVSTRHDPDAPADLHDALDDDSPAWSVRSRLTAVLGRPALATRLADALPPLLGAELADRLDTLITQAVSESEAQITQQLSDQYHAARARLDADAEKKLREVHYERYRGSSRLD